MLGGRVDGSGRDEEEVIPPTPLQPLRALDPKQLGDWTILGRLGTGGMGVAFLAERDEQWAVVKMVRSDIAEDRHHRARIERELEAMRLAESEHTAALFEQALDDDPAWFAMEFIPGVTLTREITDHGAMNRTELSAFARDLMIVLESVHAAGIVHRDLKPSNIMLSPTGPRLIDFGIADISEGTQLTRTGAVIGSTGWLAPEQVTGDPVTPATDIHAWALCVLYAATGESPFGGASASHSLYQVLEATPTVPASVPEPLNALLVSALSKDPVKRPTVARVLTALAPAPVVPAPPPPPPVARTTQVAPEDQWTQDSSTAPPPPSPPAAPPPPPPAVPPAPAGPAALRPPVPVAAPAARSSRWLLWSGIGAAVLVVGVIGIVIATQGGSSEDSVVAGVEEADATTAETDAPPTPSPEPTTASPTPEPVPPTFGLQVNYRPDGIPDQTVEDSLDWSVDLCSSDTSLLQKSYREKIGFYAREDGKWVRQDAAATTKKGGRCGKDRVNITIPRTEIAPADATVDQGWSKCRPYRVLVPETPDYARTVVDICVKTRADATV